MGPRLHSPDQAPGRRGGPDQLIMSEICRWVRIARKGELVTTDDMAIERFGASFTPRRHVPGPHTLRGPHIPIWNRQLSLLD